MPGLHKGWGLANVPARRRCTERAHRERAGGTATEGEEKVPWVSHPPGLEAQVVDLVPSHTLSSPSPMERLSGPRVTPLPVVRYPPPVLTS